MQDGLYIFDKQTLSLVHIDKGAGPSPHQLLQCPWEQQAGRLCQAVGHRPTEALEALPLFQGLIISHQWKA